MVISPSAHIPIKPFLPHCHTSQTAPQRRFPAPTMPRAATQAQPSRSPANGLARNARNRRAAKRYLLPPKRYGFGGQNVWFCKAKGMVSHAEEMAGENGRQTKTEEAQTKGCEKRLKAQSRTAKEQGKKVQENQETGERSQKKDATKGQRNLLLPHINSRKKQSKA